ncbi:MAG: hypothetical protein ACPKQO_11175, partial [Nitrososphaeraceae archaeon]
MILKSNLLLLYFVMFLVSTISLSSVTQEVYSMHKEDQRIGTQSEGADAQSPNSRVIKCSSALLLPNSQTCVGTDKRDTIIGGAGVDIIYAKDGKD